MEGNPMSTDLNRVKEIAKRNDELMHATLHGDLPMKTVMQMAEDIKFLTDLLLVGDDKNDMIVG